MTGFSFADMRRDLVREHGAHFTHLCDRDTRRLWKGLQEANAERAELLRRRDFAGYLFKFDGQKRFPAFFAIHQQMPDATYWRCLAFVWDNIEVSAPDSGQWIALFESKRGKRKWLMTAEERRAFDALPDKLRVFRGYAKGKARNGLSWTLSEDVARRFAVDYAPGIRRALLCGHEQGGPGMIISGQCYKRDALAHFIRRDEAEIVIRPDKVFSKRSRPA